MTADQQLHPHPFKPVPPRRIAGPCGVCGETTFNPVHRSPPPPDRAGLIEIAARALYEHDEAAVGRAHPDTCPGHEHTPWVKTEEWIRVNYRTDVAPIVDALCPALTTDPKETAP